MATNTGKGFRVGAVKGRTQVKNGRTSDFVKRDEDKNSRKDGKPFKGVAKEPDQRRSEGTRSPSQ